MREYTLSELSRVWKSLVDMFILNLEISTRWILADFTHRLTRFHQLRNLINFLRRRCQVLNTIFRD